MPATQNKPQPKTSTEVRAHIELVGSGNNITQKVANVAKRTHTTTMTVWRWLRNGGANKGAAAALFWELKPEK